MQGIERHSQFGARTAFGAVTTREATVQGHTGMNSEFHCGGRYLQAGLAIAGDPRVHKQIEIGEAFMDRYRDVFAVLAK
jgi:hypothetical protein